jgi:polysaccharide pyruvyl transferase CsaB
MPVQKAKTPRIMISGYYGFDNFGDEAILWVLIREIKRNIRDIDIVVLSKTPEKTAYNLQVRAIDRMNFFKIVSELTNTNILVSGGGSLLQDVTSFLTIYYYLLIIFLARLFRVECFIYAQGIGPINRKFSRLATKFILSGIKNVSVRDNKSQLLLKELNIESDLTSDPVWLGLKGDCLDVLFEIPEINNNNNVIGVNIRPWKGISVLDFQELALNISHLARKNGETLLIMPLHYNYDFDICLNLYNILQTIAPEQKTVLIDKSLTPPEWEVIISKCQKVIAMRFHALVSSIYLKKELFGISYDPKVQTLMENFNCHYITTQQWQEKKLSEYLKNWYEISNKQLSYNPNYSHYNDLAGQTIEKLVKIIK